MSNQWQAASEVQRLQHVFFSFSEYIDMFELSQTRPKAVVQTDHEFSEFHLSFRTRASSCTRYPTSTQAAIGLVEASEDGRQCRTYNQPEMKNRSPR